MGLQRVKAEHTLCHFRWRLRLSRRVVIFLSYLEKKSRLVLLGEDYDPASVVSLKVVMVAKTVRPSTCTSIELLNLTLPSGPSSNIS